jgi:hypothetical protein
MKVGYTSATIPPKGELVLPKPNAKFATYRGTSERCYDEVHPANILRANVSSKNHKFWIFRGALILWFLTQWLPHQRKYR